MEPPGRLWGFADRGGNSNSGRKVRAQFDFSQAASDRNFMCRYTGKCVKVAVRPIDNFEQMKICAWLLMGCMMHVTACAAEAEPGDMPASPAGHRPVMGISRPPQPVRRPQDAPLHESRFASAIARAAKKGQIERAVEAYTEVLIQCQQEQSPVLTTASLRSDSQQAHCFRF